MHQGLRPDELVNFCGGIKLNIVSFGGGTNSAALLVGLHQHGIPVDLITFADTGAEHPHTYRFLETMNQWLREHEMPPITVVEKMDRNGNRLTLETECLRSCTLPSIAYGFNSRVEWCACFVSWCYGQMGLSEPRFAACQSQGIPWFQSHGQWGGRDYANIAPGDAIFFDWDLDGSADHVGLVVGTDGSRVYTVEGNSGDACKIKSYSLTYECIKGYGLMNW